MKKNCDKNNFGTSTFSGKKLTKKSVLKNNKRDENFVQIQVTEI